MRTAFLCATLLVTSALHGANLEWKNTLLVQLAVKDLDRSVAFYRDVLGFTLESKRDDIRWARIKPGLSGLTIGIGESNGEIKGSGTVSLNFGVGDIDTSRAELESRGVVFTGPTRTIPGIVRLADFTDPDGNRIRLAQDLSGRR